MNVFDDISWTTFSYKALGLETLIKVTDDTFNVVIYFTLFATVVDLFLQAGTQLATYYNVYSTCLNAYGVLNAADRSELITIMGSVVCALRRNEYCSPDFKAVYLPNNLMGRECSESIFIQIYNIFIDVNTIKFDYEDEN